MREWTRVCRTAVSVLTLAGWATITHPAAAHPEVPGPSGRTCALGLFTDPAPDAPDGMVFGLMTAGPLVWDREGTLTCTLQANYSLHTGGWGRPLAGVDAESTTGGVTTMPPTMISAIVLPYDALYLCTRWTGRDGTRLYLSPREPASEVDDVVAAALPDYYWTTNPWATCPPMSVQLTAQPMAVANIVADVVNDVVNGLGLAPLLPIAICGDQPPVDLPGILVIDEAGDIEIAGQPVWDCPDPDVEPEPDPVPPQPPQQQSQQAAGHYG